MQNRIKLDNFIDDIEVNVNEDKDGRVQVFLDDATIESIKTSLGLRSLQRKILARQKSLSSNIFASAKNVIAVMSGKGGVGKSTVTTEVALEFANMGAKVGILDADIYGPSLPTITGIFDQPNLNEQNKIIPHVFKNIYTQSIGYLVNEEAALAWRGPMVSKALQQLAIDTQWPELDYLFIDMPPGTGDLQITLAQKFPLTGVLIVTTPHVLATSDVVRAIRFCEKLNIHCLGYVENMAFLECQNCGSENNLFMQDENAKSKISLPMLGKLPFSQTIQRYESSPFITNLCINLGIQVAKLPRDMKIGQLVVQNK